MNGICMKTGNCSRYCYVCTLDTTTMPNMTMSYCAICYPGYIHVGNGVCSPAIGGCVVHYPFNTTQCEVCGPGTVLNPFELYCQPCPLYCEKCTIAGVCYECYTGYYITGHNVVDMACVPNCSYPCLTCSHTDPTKCTSCEAGYTFNENANNGCEPVTDCAPNACVICPGGFVMSNTSQCVACNPDCMTCMSTNTSFCTSCMGAFYVKDGACSPCL